jgi:DUF4097 and DUF4098 domain-containing protein YvlB
MRNRLFLFSAILFSFGCFACTAYADVWDKEWSVPANAQVHVNANFGNIRTDAGESTQIKAFVRTRGWRIAGDDISVTANQTDNKIELEVKLLQRRTYWQFNYEITIELMVPRSATLDLHTDHGNITTHGIEGSLRSDTGDGNIEAVGGKGTIRLHTGDGNINANELDGSLSVDTGDGNVSVEGRFDALDVRTGDGNLNGTANAGSRLLSPWRFQTGDGNVLLRLQASVGANLDATTGGGRVMIDFPVTTSGALHSKTLRGPMNGGGQQLYIHTGDGNIHIAKQ